MAGAARRGAGPHPVLRVLGLGLLFFLLWLRPALGGAAAAAD